MSGKPAQAMALSLDHARLASGVPRLAPTLIHRPRVNAWFTKHEDSKALIVIAPIGFGKTTAVVEHIVKCGRLAGYLRLGATDVPERFRARLGKLLGATVAARTYEEQLDQLERCPPTLLCFDEIDRAPDATRLDLASLLVDAPSNLTLVFVGRSRSAVPIERAAIRGIADVCVPDMLAFGPDEIASMAEACGVEHRAADVAQFHESTEGWPLVVGAAVREAAQRALPLGAAYDAWRTGPGRHFPRYVAEELSRASDLDRSVLQLALRGSGLSEADEVRMADLEARGLLVHRVGDRYEPFRVLRDFSAPLVSFIGDGSAAPIPALNVRMLGRFEAAIGERPIQWVRRRDQQLFKYLLLQPSGAATRGELLETFWAGTDAQLATQSLRTACSNIRKAIAAIAGQENVARYFSSRGDVGVNFAGASTDLQRFTTLLREGDVALEAGKTTEALAAYRAAESLYGGGLLAGEAPERWYASKVQAYQALYLGLLERIGTLTRSLQTGEPAPDSHIDGNREAPHPERAGQPAPPNAYRPSRPLLDALRTRNRP